MRSVTLGYQPMPVHAPFHKSAAYERAMFGAFGSGKTYAVCAEAIAWCLEQPGIRGAIARLTIPSLRDTTEPIFFELLPPEIVAAGKISRSGGHVSQFTFPNGSVVYFRSLDDPQKWRSMNLGFLVYDEANEVPEDTYMQLKSRVRQRDITAEARLAGYTHEITRRGIWLATNPSGHDWLWRYFVDKPEGDRVFFKSTSLQNPFLPPEYVDSLLSYPEAWVRRYVLCSFDDFAGSIYPDWQWETHVVARPKYPPGAVFWMGMDPGTRNPTAGLWCYVDQEKRRLVGVAEYQEANVAAAAHALAWRRIEAQHRMTVRRRIADPNVNTRDRGTMETLSDIYRKLGYSFANGPRMHKDRIPILGQAIALGRFVVTEDCPQTFEAIKNYRWEDLTPAMVRKGADPKESPLKDNDHLVDCAQYLASQYLSPQKVHLHAPGPSSPQEELSQDVQRAIRKQIGRRRRPSSSHQLGGIAV